MPSSNDIAARRHELSVRVSANDHATISALSADQAKDIVDLPLDGLTPLDEAIKGGHAEAAMALLRCGAHIHGAPGVPGFPATQTPWERALAGSGAAGLEMVVPLLMGVSVQRQPDDLARCWRELERATLAATGTDRFEPLWDLYERASRRMMRGLQITDPRIERQVEQHNTQGRSR